MFYGRGDPSPTVYLKFITPPNVIENSIKRDAEDVVPYGVI